jgi:hypothetical protein
MAAIPAIRQVASNLRPDYQEEPDSAVRTLALGVANLADQYLRRPRGNARAEFLAAIELLVGNFQGEIPDPLKSTLAELVRLCKS